MNNLDWSIYHKKKLLLILIMLDNKQMNLKINLITFFKTKYDKIETLIRNNIQKCQNWCTKHNVAFNTL